MHCLGTPLFFVLHRGNVAVVRTLLDCGADVNQMHTRPLQEHENLKLTPLCYVLLCWYNIPELVQLLLDRGADVDQRCGLKDT